MATQRLVVATIGGAAAAVVETLWRGWHSNATCEPAVVDGFCTRLRDNATVVPVIFFCEWVDRWLMGNLVPGPGAVAGKRYQVSCLSPQQACAWADKCGNQWREQQWLAIRLREAAEGWETAAEPRTIVVIRDVLDVSTTDEDVRAAQRIIPRWLAELQK